MFMGFRIDIISMTLPRRTDFMKYFVCRDKDEQYLLVIMNYAILKKCHAMKTC